MSNGATFESLLAEHVKDPRTTDTLIPNAIIAPRRR